MKQQSRDNIGNLAPGHTQARSASYDPCMPTQALKQAEPDGESRSRHASRSRNITETFLPASPREYIPLKDRDPTRWMRGRKPLAIAEASLDQPAGLPQYMSPRPLGLEEPCQV